MAEDSPQVMTETKPSRIIFLVPRVFLKFACVRCELHHAGTRPQCSLNIVSNVDLRLEQDPAECTPHVYLRYVSDCVSKSVQYR